jgi:hypothetical protein
MINNTHHKLKNRNFVESELIRGVCNVSNIVYTRILVYAIIFPRHRLELHLIKNEVPFQVLYYLKYRLPQQALSKPIR